VSEQRVPGWLRPTIDYGPLAVFFAAYMIEGLMVATAALIVATVLVLGLSMGIQRTVPKLPLITAGIVAVFGGLTLALDDPAFIKMKPTIVQAVFAIVLLGGLAFGRALLKPVLGMAMPWTITERGWRQLTLRWGVFFAAMAVLNEAVWRTQTTDFWVTFKVFGLLGLTIAFAMAQMPLMTREKVEDEAG
jgi:intracellular septation protein